MSSASSNPNPRGGQPSPASAPGSATGAPDPQVASRIRQRPQGKRLAQPAEAAPALTPEQRLLILDTWQRSGLPAGDFALLVGLSKDTLYAWRKKFEAEGPAGLMDRPRGTPEGSRLPELGGRCQEPLFAQEPSIARGEKPA